MPPRSKAAAEPAIRLRPSYYGRPDYFTTDVLKGTTRTASGSRICALTNDFVLGFREAVIYECGKAYRKVFKECGRRWGMNFAKKFEKEISNYYGMPLAELSTAVVHANLSDAFNYHGWGKLKIDLSECDSGLIVASIDNPMLPSLVQEADRTVDVLNAGLLAGIFTVLSGQQLDCVQTDCPSLGADKARFIIGWQPRIEALDKWLVEAAPHGVIPHEAVMKKVKTMNTAAALTPEN